MKIKKETDDDECGNGQAPGTHCGNVGIGMCAQDQRLIRGNVIEYAGVCSVFLSRLCG